MNDSNEDAINMNVAINMLGCHYDKLKYYDLALECFKKVHLRDKEKPIYLYNYTSLLITINRCNFQEPEEFEEIKRLMEKYVKLCPEDFDGYRELGNLYTFRDEEIKYEYYYKAFNRGWFRSYYALIYHYKSILDKEGNEEIREDLKRKINLIVDRVSNEVIRFDEKSKENKEKEELEEGEITEVHLQEQLSSTVITNLGLLYSEGNLSVQRNTSISFKLWKIAYNNDESNMSVRYNLGLAYMFGQGCDVDMDKAFDLFMESEEDCDSQRKIAEFYQKGKIKRTPKNRAIALEWYLRSANNKDENDYLSCFKVAELSDETKTKSKYLLKAIDQLRKSTMEEYKEISIPKDVLLLWHDKINVKNPKLKKEIVELKCRPPMEGGAEYLKAKENFESKKRHYNFT